MWPDGEGKTESFGEYLKRERELRNISLDEISKATRIRKYYLDAIERDEFKLLPGEAYLKGFVRAYAKHIGIDPDEAILRLESALKSYEQKKTPIPVRKKINIRIPIYPVAAGGLIIIVLVLILIGREEKREYKKAVQKIEKIEAVSRPPQESVPQEKKGQEQVNPPPQTEPLRVTIKAKERTWVMVKRDDEKPFDVILWEGDVQKWEAKTRLSLRIGNAQGVEIIYNGVPLRNLGAKGEVVGIILPDDLSRFQ